jgi:twitching motility protein PilT
LLKCAKVAVTRADIVEYLLINQDEIGIKVLNLEELLSRKGDVDFSVTSTLCRWRGNIYSTDNKKLTIAMRKLEQRIPELSSLGLPEAYFQMATRSKGLLLVTGPTGSGKTTTLASTIDYLNKTTRRHILTIEDPVEFIHKSDSCLIHQRQIGRDGKDFSSGLRAALREDPDVIFIGEMRDRDTVQVALDAANTGHLVLATLHTLNSRQTIERITSFFPADEKDWAQQVLATVLIGVLSQVLIPTASGSGSRVLGAELLVNTPAVKIAIRDGKLTQIFNAMDTGRREGHVLMNNSLAEKVRAGIISLEDALYYAYDPKGLDSEMAHG